MAKPYPWYFTIDGRPVEVVGANDVRAMDPATGVMMPDGSYAERIARGGPGVRSLSRDRYSERLDVLGQPILERYASTPLVRERTGDSELLYRGGVGHLAYRDGAHVRTVVRGGPVARWRKRLARCRTTPGRRACYRS